MKNANYRREALIELLADVSDQRTKTEKCLAVGYKNEKEIFRLQRDPEFRAAVLAKMREHLGVNLPLVYRRLFAIAETGTDKDAIRACDALLRAAGEIAAATTSQTVNVLQKTGEPEEPFDVRLRRVLEKRDREAGLIPRVTSEAFEQDYDIKESEADENGDE